MNTKSNKNIIDIMKKTAGNRFTWKIGDLIKDNQQSKYSAKSTDKEDTK